MSDPTAVAAVLRAHLGGDVQYLIEALRDADSGVRALAAEYLGESGDERAISPLLPLIRAENPHVRAGAVRALGTLGATASLEGVTDLARNDPIVWVREWAIDAVVKMSDADPVPILTGALRDSSRSVRRLAVAHLMDRGDVGALDEIRFAMAAENPFRRRMYRRAIRALQKAG